MPNRSGNKLQWYSQYPWDREHAKKIIREWLEELPEDFEYKVEETMKQLGFVREASEPAKEPPKPDIPWFVKESPGDGCDMLAHALEIDPNKMSKMLWVLGLRVTKP